VGNFPAVSRKIASSCHPPPNIFKRRRRWRPDVWVTSHYAPSLWQHSITCRRRPPAYTVFPSSKHSPTNCKRTHCMSTDDGNINRLSPSTDKPDDRLSIWRKTEVPRTTMSASWRVPTHSLSHTHKRDSAQTFSRWPLNHRRNKRSDKYLKNVKNVKRPGKN